MAQINDFRIEQSRDERLRQIEEINSLFDVEFEEVRNAADAAGMRMSLEGMTYYFFAKCVSEGKDLRNDIDAQPQAQPDIIEAYDQITERADSCVPFQSYVAMYIWVDCGYDMTNSDNPYSLTNENIVQIAQFVLYDYAFQAITHAFED